MAHIYSPNIAAVANDAFAHLWQGVRAMLKSGWLLKHSADATNKASANPSDPANCKWVAPAVVQDFSGVGVGVATIGAKIGKDYLFTNMSGLVVPSTANLRGGSEGNLLVVTNAASPGNNTTWLITRVVSAFSCYARPLVPAPHTTAGVPGTTITVNGHCQRVGVVTTAIRVQPATTGALGTATVKFSMDDGATYSTPVTIPSNGIVEIIDVNGVATGLYVVVAGSITNAGIGVDYWRIPWAVQNDANAGAIRWIEKSWLTSAYSAMANGAWILLEGPPTLKIPFTSAPIGTFIRGENVTQATSLAEGEVVGVTYEPTTGVGYVVIQPRLMGSGAGAEGWGTGIITGSRSGAIVAPSVLPIRLVREMVFWRGNTLGNGTVYYQPVLDATENAQRFGYLSLQSGCTATVAPGGATGTFPSIAYAVTGTGGAASHNSTAWLSTNYSLANTIGKLQHFAANAIEKPFSWASATLPNTSGDGSHVGLIGQPTNNASSTAMLPVFMRCDNGEDGDLEPYVSFVSQSMSVSIGTMSRSRTGNTAAANSGEACPNLWGIATQNSSYGAGWWVGWRRRGLSTADAYAEYAVYFLYAPLATNQYLQWYANNLVDQDRVASTAASPAPLAMEPLTLACPTTTTRQRKGTTRWLWLGTGASSYDTYGARTILQCYPTTVNSMFLGLFMPYDGSTVPAQ